MGILGWVYVITNRAIPGLVKIGFSTKDPEIRARELANTGAPYPYTVAFDALVKNPQGVEQLVHRQLLGKREGKEWFRCSISEAAKVIEACAPRIYLSRREGTIRRDKTMWESQLQEDHAESSTADSPVPTKQRVNRAIAELKKHGHVILNVKSEYSYGLTQVEKDRALLAFAADILGRQID